MHDEPDHHERPVTPLGRSAQSMLLRRWPEFFIEFILIIAGILAALAIDGWVQDRADRKSERAYLELLRDDLIQIENELQGYVAFETKNLETGTALYRALDPEATDRQPDELQTSFASLSGRRTVQINSAAYSDLQSTGNLQVVKNQALRQSIVRYFSQTERTELVIEKNNSALVDNLFTQSLFDLGITNGLGSSAIAEVMEADGRLLDLLGDDVSMPHDAILHQPRGATSWDDLRRHVLFRTRVASIGITLGNQAIDASREMRTAIEEELRNPI